MVGPERKVRRGLECQFRIPSKKQGLLMRGPSESSLPEPQRGVYTYAINSKYSTNIQIFILLNILSMFLMCIKCFALIHDFLEGRGHFSSVYLLITCSLSLLNVRHIERGICKILRGIQCKLNIKKFDKITTNVIQS